MADVATDPSSSTGEQSYVKCGRCQTAYVVSDEDLGNGKGRRLECSVCEHSWFQSKDRLMTLRDGFEMVSLPDLDKERISLNIKEGKNPRFMGDTKLYVGNIAFECTEDDLVRVFSEAGVVGDISLVRDEQGRNRGFGFITMRTKEGGEKAMETLDGSEFMGRNIAVRESNSN
eukprot:CAMPEP_0202480058 /NCGR_PEP_ID=MMETSP1361-20130828/197_1 /ASSEMBLY_ACC=CAM_ASM_000849 /TAXON_ID=210615 /ORGANISM="Staurosira complex sp., Strain CCMP2646" /LENGTH=172 /DNA_ID=CAMNT_0049107451 /DNA_START=143 /DNA_END=661 /DNA_ORIENTATION=+